jgi:hypothetical protein
MNPGGMIAEVMIEGIVTGNRWTYNEEQLFRLAHFRSIDRNPNFRGRQQVADYFTVRVRQVGIAAQLPEEGDHIIVVGYLTDRQEDVSLADFNRRARGNEKLPDDLVGAYNGLAERRSITEVVATRIQNVTHEERGSVNNHQRERRRCPHRQSRRQRDQPSASVEQEPTVETSPDTASTG